MKGMGNMKKMIKTIGWTLLAAFTYYIMEVMFNMVFWLVVPETATAEERMNLLLIANLVMKLVVMLVFGFWYMVRENKWHYRPDYRSVFTVKTILCLAGIGLLGQYAIGFLMSFIRIAVPDIFRDYERVTETLSLSNGSPLITILIVVIIGPIAEEVLFRGVIYGKLRDSFNVTQAAVISAAIFGIYHKNIVQGIYAALFGIILAYIFEKTQTIWGSVLMHMVFNLSSYLILWLSHLAENQRIAIPALAYLGLELACIVLVILCICALYKRPNRYDEIKKRMELSEA